MVCTTWCNLVAKESGLECTCMNNDDFTVLVSGTGRYQWMSTCLCGRSIQNDWVSRAMNLHQILRLAWKFLCGNYSDDSEGRSYGKLVNGSFITTTHPHMHHILCSFFHETSSHPGDSGPLQLRFGKLWLLDFPKTGIIFERERIQENMTGQLMEIGRIMCGLKMPIFRGTEASRFFVQCVLYFVSSSINVSFFFHIVWLDSPGM